MKKYLAVLTAIAFLGGCGEVGDTMMTKRDNVEHHEGDGHDHGSEAEHDHGHDHAHEDGHDHGEHLELGTATAAGVSFEAVQLGKMSGAEQAVEIVLQKDAAKPAALRAWVGNEAGDGSMKVKADGEGPEYEMHLEMPQPVPADAKLWVEVESATGERGTASFDLKR